MGVNAVGSRSMGLPADGLQILQSSASSNVQKTTISFYETRFSLCLENPADVLQKMQENCAKSKVIEASALHLREALRDALQKGHDGIVLKNFWGKEALAFADLLNEPEFKRRFKQIDFAFEKSVENEGKIAAFQELCDRLNDWNKRRIAPWTFWTSDRFDLAVSALAVASFFIPQCEYGGSLVKGLQGFAMANLADRCLRRFFLPSFEKRGEPLLAGAVNAILEEGIYGGILQIRAGWGALFRFPVSWALGESAARSIVSVEEKPVGFSSAAKIGALWAAFREMLNWTPGSVSTPLLIAGDSAVCGLIGVCPKKKAALRLPVLSREWTYKVLSGGVFRGIANCVAFQSGFLAAAVQHVLFNFSRSLPENLN